MSRYIDAEALLKDLKEELEIASPMLNEVENKWINKGVRIAIKDVKRFPTADVVEVVRCKDCKNRDTEACPVLFWDCGELMGETEDNDYCSYGERSENGK